MDGVTEMLRVYVKCGVVEGSGGVGSMEALKRDGGVNTFSS